RGVQVLRLVGVEGKGEAGGGAQQAHRGAQDRKADGLRARTGRRPRGLRSRARRGVLPHVRYASRRALVISSRAARAAGNRPPNSPIAREKITPATSRGGVSSKLNMISAKVWELLVPVGAVRKMLTMTAARAPPTTPPSSPRHVDSSTNEIRTTVREKPRARRVAISRVRADTCAYIVFIAPNDAPMAMITATR